jgi:protein gp37
MPATNIEWAHDSENFAAGCTEARLANGKMDDACLNCYARLQSARNESIASAAGRVSIYTGTADRSGNTARWTGTLTWDRELMRRRFQAMKGGRRVFPGSMTDLWHEDHDPALLVALAEEFRLLGKRPPEKRPIVITLTKRADRLLIFQREHFPEGLPAWVWPGVTAGCQDAANERVPLLLQVRAEGPRVVSVEPMTGPVDLSVHLKDHHHRALLLARDGRWGTCSGCPRDDDGTPHPKRCQYTDRYDHNLEDDRIGWVIAGGESGTKARPSNLDWFRALRDQCVAAGVPFFFKQWGEWAPDYYINDDDPPGTPPRQAAESMSKVGKHAAGRLLDGRTWDEVPDVG